MRESDKADVFNAAVERLVTDTVDRVKPRQPGAYAATLRADLRTRLRPAARAMFDAHDDLTTDELATLLGEQEKAPKGPAPRCEPRSPSSALPTFTADPWEPAPPSVRREAKERIAAIRAQLDTTKEQRA